ncbi:unnamed protein product, partial [Allacma fusca]
QIETWRGAVRKATKC